MPQFRRSQWFYDAGYGVQPGGRSPGSFHPAEGELVGQDCSCGEPLRWIYGYKRRRPSMRCLKCNPL
jgi:hypothetical protein